MNVAIQTPLSSVPSIRGTRLRARTAVARQAARPAAVSVKAVVQDPPAAAPALKPYGVFNLNYDASKDRTQFGKQWKKPLKIAVSGAAGAIANHLLFTLASGEVFGDDQPISLLMLGSDRSRGALEGVAMELEDSLFPLLREVSIGTDPRTLFEGADWALLIGAKPRGPGMERRDLLDLNGQIFVEQGKALNDVADKDCKVVVVGNPCNTNAMIAASQAPRLDKRNFHALTRLDENRAKCQIALKSGVHYRSVSNVTIWGNHSTTQVPDFVNSRVNGQRVTSVIDSKWLETDFTTVVQTRGGALIKKWGRSSAASTAVSIADHMRSLVVPTPKGDWFSMAVCSDGNPYGIKDGLWYSFPCTSNGDGTYEIVKGLEMTPWLREKIAASEKELEQERDCVKHLMGEAGGSCEIKADTMLPGEN